MIIGLAEVTAFVRPERAAPSQRWKLGSTKRLAENDGNSGSECSLSGEVQRTCQATLRSGIKNRRSDFGHRQI
jgi:hypothetical protein